MDGAAFSLVELHWHATCVVEWRIKLSAIGKDHLTMSFGPAVNLE